MFALRIYRPVWLALIDLYKIHPDLHTRPLMPLFTCHGLSVTCCKQFSDERDVLSYVESCFCCVSRFNFVYNWTVICWRCHGYHRVAVVAMATDAVQMTDRDHTRWWQLMVFNGHYLMLLLLLLLCRRFYVLHVCFVSMQDLWVAGTRTLPYEQLQVALQFKL